MTAGLKAARSGVWVLGARGMLGQAVCAHLDASSSAYVASGSEVDVTRADAIAHFAEANRAAVWINCAAMTAVDACETDEAAAARNEAVNAVAPGLLAAAAAKRGAKLVHVSTDYVFAGTARAPYGEADGRGPKTAYGRAKARGEDALWRALGPAHQAQGYVVRTSWLFGPHGPNFVATMLGLMQARERLAVVDDQVGRPSYTVDLAEALVALPQRAAGGTYHFANDGVTSWCGFAREILAQAQGCDLPLRCLSVEATDSAAFVRPAPRPAYSVLATDKLADALGKAPRPYQAALADYFAATRSAVASPSAP